MKIYLVVHEDGDSRTYDAFRAREHADECAEETYVSYFSSGVELDRSGDLWTGTNDHKPVRLEIQEVDLQ